MKRILDAITIGFLLTYLLSGSAAGLDWRDLDISDENSALRRGIESGKILDAGEWGAKTFPILAKEIWQNNIHQGQKQPYPLSPYQKKWLTPWLEKWGVEPDEIQIVYEAELLNDHKILDRWPIAIMDQLAGQTFGNIIYLRQAHKSKDGNLWLIYYGSTHDISKCSNICNSKSSISNLVRIKLVISGSISKVVYGLC